MLLRRRVLVAKLSHKRRRLNVAPSKKSLLKPSSLARTCWLGRTGERQETMSIPRLTMIQSINMIILLKEMLNSLKQIDPRSSKTSTYTSSSSRRRLTMPSRWRKLQARRTHSRVGSTSTTSLRVATSSAEYLRTRTCFLWLSKSKIQSLISLLPTPTGPTLTTNLEKIMISELMDKHPRIFSW